MLKIRSPIAIGKKDKSQTKSWETRNRKIDVVVKKGEGAEGG
jgi:hypothetical protein